MRSTMTDYYNAGAGIGAGLFGNRQKEKREDKKVKEARAYSNIQTNNQQAFQREMQEYANVMDMLNTDARMVHDNAQLDKTLGNRLELQKLSDSADLMRSGVDARTNAAKTEEEMRMAAAKDGVNINLPNWKEIWLARRDEMYGQEAGAKGLSNKAAKVGLRNAKLQGDKLVESLAGDRMQNNLGLIDVGGVPFKYNPSTGTGEPFIKEGILPSGDYGSGWGDTLNFPKVEVPGRREGKKKNQAQQNVESPVSMTPGALPSDLQYFDFLLRNNLHTTDRY